jgi:hypothetical protein
MSFLAVAILASAAVAAPAPVSFDAARHAVTFTATETDCGLDAQVEFLFVGPDSDRDYESVFVTDARVSEIAEAFDKAGIPRGKPIDQASARVWPVGETLSIEPPLSELVKDSAADGVRSVVYPGGTRGEKGFPEADTNMPSAVFALYNCPQSLLQIDDNLGQSETYGRFTPAKKPVKGRRRVFTVSWNGTNSFETVAVKLSPGALADAMRLLKERSKLSPIDVMTDFSVEMTVKEAGECASALAMVDSRRVKFNSFAPGQFYFRAFLPLEKWRERSGRLAQPPEVHLGRDGIVRVHEIKEDWSDEKSIDPKLVVKTTEFADLSKAGAEVSRLADRTSTVLLFAPQDMRLAKLFDFKSKVSKNATIWYVFGE